MNAEAGSHTPTSSLLSETTFFTEERILRNRLKQLIAILSGLPLPFQSLILVPRRWVKNLFPQFKVHLPLRSSATLFLGRSSPDVSSFTLDPIHHYPLTHPFASRSIVLVRGAQMGFGVNAILKNRRHWHGEWFFSPDPIFQLWEELVESLPSTNPAIADFFTPQPGNSLRSDLSTPLIPVPIAKLLISWREEDLSHQQGNKDYLYTILWKLQSELVKELDENRLLPLIARTLQEGLGYDFFEIVIYEAVGSHRTVARVFQKNDTPYGGSAIQIILNEQFERDLFRKREPVVLHPFDVERTLMNPNLWNLMGINEGLVIPLTLRRKAFGIIILLARKRDHYGHLPLDWCRKIGEMIVQQYLNAQSHSRARHLAIIDGLTRVFNHRFFVEQLSRELKRARRYQNPLTLLMLDIDHFKHYNDNWGHLQGDKVLCEVANLVKRQVREVDWVCRYGGEEFAIILPETELRQGLVVAEKIRQAIALRRFRHGSSQPMKRVTVSIGAAELTPDIDDPGELVNRADTALYHAKRLGRNRCEAFYVTIPSSADTQ
ncbi:MAG: GGDEF domain-containing protein [bacterium]